MDLRSPIPAPRYPDPDIGPFTGAALQAELNRENAAIAFQCVRAQIGVIAVALLSCGLAASMFLGQVAKYERALALCAGV